MRFSDNNEADFEGWAADEAERDAEDCRRRRNRERMRRLRASRDPEEERRKNRERMRARRADRLKGGE